MSTEPKIIETLKHFFSNYPELFNTRKKNPVLDIEIENRVKNHFKKNIIPSIPKTIPDPSVSVILKDYYDIPDSELEKIQKQHQLSMAAENKVGDYLELYISETAYKINEWILCVDGIVKAIDFIKRDGNSWKMLQVKNRDNSENSSSNKIRNHMKEKYNIEIQKWHRTNALSGTTNWKNFPDEKLKKILNENDFRLFIRRYIQQIKNKEKEGLLI